jgi:hypothetical protein
MTSPSHALPSDVSGAIDLNETYQLSTPLTAGLTGGLAESPARSRNAYPYFANLFSHHFIITSRFVNFHYKQLEQHGFQAS